VASLLVLVIWFGFYVGHKAVLIFYPYPTFHWPVLHPLLLGSLFLLAAPFVLSRPPALPKETG
jgi:hypothetical protein